MKRGQYCSDLLRDPDTMEIMTAAKLVIVSSEYCVQYSILPRFCKLIVYVFTLTNEDNHPIQARTEFNTHRNMPDCITWLVNFTK